MNDDEKTQLERIKAAAFRCDTLAGRPGRNDDRSEHMPATHDGFYVEHNINCGQYPRTVRVGTVLAPCNCGLDDLRTALGTK